MVKVRQETQSDSFEDVKRKESKRKKSLFSQIRDRIGEMSNTAHQMKGKQEIRCVFHKEIFLGASEKNWGERRTWIIQRQACCSFIPRSCIRIIHKRKSHFGLYPYKHISM